MSIFLDSHNDRIVVHTLPYSKIRAMFLPDLRLAIYLSADIKHFSAQNLGPVFATGRSHLIEDSNPRESILILKVSSKYAEWLDQIEVEQAETPDGHPILYINYGKVLARPAREVSIQRVQWRQGSSSKPAQQQSASASSSSPKPPVGKTLSKMLFIIDPGHGGPDGGAPSPSGDKPESHHVLQIGLELREMLLDLGAKVSMTRSKDVDVSLESRPALANEWARRDSSRDAIFISLHCNAIGGAPTYVEAINGVETHGIAGTQGYQEALKFQDKLTNHLKKQGFARVTNRGVKATNLYVNRHTDMPAFLLEAGFMGGAYDRNMINQHAKYARAIADTLNQVYGV